MQFGGIPVHAKVICPTIRRFESTSGSRLVTDCFPDNDKRRECLMSLTRSLTQGCRKIPDFPSHLTPNGSYDSESDDLPSPLVPAGASDTYYPLRATLKWNARSDRGTLERFITNMVNGPKRHSVDNETRASLPDHFGIVFKFQDGDDSKSHAFALERVTSTLPDQGEFALHAA